MGATAGVLGTGAADSAFLALASAVAGAATDALFDGVTAAAEESTAAASGFAALAICVCSNEVGAAECSGETAAG